MSNDIKKQLENFAKNLKKERLAKKLSHDQLATIAKVHRTSIGHIESGISKPSLAIALKLSYALNKPLFDLLND